MNNYMPEFDPVRNAPSRIRYWRRAWEYTKGEVPIVVTENGIGTDDDAQRMAYVRTALEGVLACLADGIDVRGYTYWSLLDNFEWAFGYRPKFGLVSVDRTTFDRTPKPSAQWLGQIAKEKSTLWMGIHPAPSRIVTRAQRPESGAPLLIGFPFTTARTAYFRCWSSSC